MARRPFQGWERDFIYLSYPLFDTLEIAKTTNRSSGVIMTFVNSKFAIRKFQEQINVNDKFGKLTVIHPLPSKNQKRMWQCKCTCGKVIETSTAQLRRPTLSCGCLRLEKITRDYGNITGTWYGLILKNAKTRGFNFDLSPKFLSDLLEKQNFKCALSGLPIYIKHGRSCEDYYQGTTASLDRIDNNKEYTEDNVQFLHKHINYMKWTHDQDYFIELCNKVSNHVSKSCK